MLQILKEGKTICNLGEDKNVADNLRVTTLTEKALQFI